MKRYIIIVAGVLSLAACSQPTGKQTTAKPAKAKQAKCKYTCIMDKDVCADKPGVCPKCGMQLVEKSE